MGIETECPSFNNACSLCFPANKTPDILWASVTGIKYGDLWSVSDGPAPNGIFQLTHTASCQWNNNHPMGEIQFKSLVDSSQFVINRSGIGVPFTDTIASPCEWFFENANVNPATEKWYGGQVLIFFTCPGVGPGIQNMMDKLNIAVEAGTYCEPVPATEDTAVYRICRKKDATNVKILFDYS